ncbi:MAG: hypothetical protein ABJQ34_21415 [Paracoccaceae bacterium]|uniref:hypothetical protein n=1 Tax=Sulfitobacter sp. TaxID=1903071 RepID=UPI0032797BC4
MARPAAGGVTGLCVLSLLPVQPFAQSRDETGGRRTEITIGQNLEFSDNPDFVADGDSQLVSLTSLGLTHERRTTIDALVFRIGGDFELGTGDLDGSAFQDPFLVLSFDRDVRHSRLGLSVQYSETDVSNSDTSGLIDLSDDVLGSDVGTRQNLTLEISGATGVDAPIGADFDIRRDQLRYSDTTDTSLLDEDTNTLEGGVTFRFSPRLSLRSFVQYTDRDVNGPGGVDRETTILGATLDAEISDILSGNLTLSYDEIEFLEPNPSTVDGLSISGGLTRLTSNGSWGLTFSSDVGESGRRDQVSLRRDLELKSGSLGLSFGATHTEGLSTDPLYGIDWTRDLARGSISLSLDQSVTSDALATEQIDTSLSLGVTQEVTDLSSLSLDASLRDSNELGAAGIDSRRIDVSLTYRRELERDWDMVGGYRYSHSTQDGSADRDSNTIFIGLERSLVWN